jgi:hypothetical protein
MRKIDLLALSLVTILGGCALPVQAPLSTTTSSRIVSEKNYTVGVSRDAVVGADIIRIKDYVLTSVTTDQVKVLSDFEIDDTKFTSGQMLPYAGTVAYSGQQYRLMKFGDGSHAVMFDTTGIVLNKIFNALGTENATVMVYTFAVNPPGKHLELATQDRVDAHATNINYQIIFTGITGDTLRMSYREYSADDLARPAFSQELTYPLKSKQVRFRNLVIDVGEVSGDKIRYTVVSDTAG